MRYIVWYSWGIDSSFVAWKLKSLWHEVLLVNLKITDEPNNCCNINSQIITSAKSLWLPLEIVDIVDEFKKYVIDDFVEQYVAWRTPNPCIRCNELVRFKILDKIRIEKWYDFVATGHYAKILDYKSDRYLWVWVDKYKDQTYMLYRLANQVNMEWKPLLNYLDFIMWDYEKTQVMKIINKENLPIILAKESQNICFIPDDDYKRFIKQNSSYNISQWPVYDSWWKYIWEHRWIIFYTIWQRFWVDQISHEKLYVIKIDLKTNSIIVGPESMLFVKQIRIKDYFLKTDILDWNSFLDWNVLWKIRYHHPLVEINSIEQEDDILIINFNQEVKAVTPGQHCVLYYRISSGIIVIWGWFII